MAIMKKSYLLLRNNRQSGPFTIDELLQQQLQPTDLVWVEGQSVAWCYPPQLTDLNGQPPTAKSIIRKEKKPKKESIVAKPYYEDNLEKRAEALRNKILSDPQLQNTYTQVSLPSVDGTSFYAGNEKGVELVYHSNKKYVTLSQLATVGVVTAVLAMAWYGNWSPVNTKSVSQSAVTPLVTTEENMAKAAFDNTPVAVLDTVNPVISPQQTATVTLPREIKASKTAVDTINPVAVTAAKENTVTEALHGTMAAVEDKQTSVTYAVEKKQAVEETKKEEPVMEEEPKKKGLGQTLRSIFKKKKKDDTTEETTAID
jgi:hypothetical protein